MRVLVTGASGFIGSHVVKKLLSVGYQVRLTHRKHSNLYRLDGLDVEKSIADVRDPESMERALSGCRAVIHCASLSNWKDLLSPALREIIVDGTRIIADYCQKNSIRMVYVSSAAALGASKFSPEIRHRESEFNLDPDQFTYAALKSEADNLCSTKTEEGADIVMVHPVETYGPGDDQMVTASTLKDFLSLPICVTCDGGTSIAHVEDVANGIVAALERGKSGNKYILGSENLSILELAELTLKVADRKKPIVKIPRRLLNLLIDTMFRIPLPFFRENRAKLRYATYYWYFETEPCLKELGVPFRSAEKIVEETVNWLGSKG
ncbi:MAG: NAD-dependent epimerase/dehydratase family protein [Opitutales bacterium]|nr:NAD-dependent epimerase/dehydratase family protein [Opitutales bacterium]